MREGAPKVRIFPQTLLNVILEFDDYVDKSKNVEILENYGIMCLGYQCRAMKQRELCSVALLYYMGNDEAIVYKKVY